LLSARLDSLGSSKAVAQLGSVLGRSFSYEMLARVSEGSAEALGEALSRLVSADLLIAGNQGADADYTFKHALVQNAAYEGLLLSRRRTLHGRVAQVLAAHSMEAVEAHPEQLAFHLTHAENFVDAACQWQRAGVLSAQRSANREAVVHFESALTMLERIPIATRDQQQELDVLIGLTGALRATRGYAAPEIGDASQRALQLARSLGSDLGELQALNSIYSFHLVAAQYIEAEAAAQELREVAIRAGQDTYAMIGYRAVGAVAFHRGHLHEAEESLQHALSLYDPERHAHLTTLYGSNHAETCACFLSLTKFAIGKQNEAIDLQSWAVEHSRAINHAHSLAQALAYRAFLFCLAGDPERIEADSQSAMTLAGEHRFRLMETFASCTIAIAQATGEPTPERIAAVEQAIERLHRLARNALRPFLLSLAAELCRRAGMIERGLALLDEADGIIHETMERWAEAEGRRVRGRLLADSGAIGFAETCFRDAIAIAESQAAESWRLRAATDLATLLRRRVGLNDANAASERATDEKGSSLATVGAWDAVDMFSAAAYLRDGTALGTDPRVEVRVH
jgi:tetratricopeptide (TPR) repeat protein